VPGALGKLIATLAYEQCSDCWIAQAVLICMFSLRCVTNQNATFNFKSGSKLLFTAKTLMEPDRIGSGKCYHREIVSAIILRVVARLVGY